MSCGIGRRCGLDLVWLWLWCRPAAVVPYAGGFGPIKTKKEKKEKEKRKEAVQKFLAKIKS